ENRLKMKLLLFLCVGASLFHLGVQEYSYMTVKVPKHLPPSSSSDYAFLIIESNYGDLESTYEEIDDSASNFHSTDGLTIFLNANRSPLNGNAEVIATDFKNPTDAVSKLNSYVTKHTSGKINNFFRGLKATTDAVVLNCADKWKIPVTKDTSFPVQLTGTYNAWVNKKSGFTLIEAAVKEYKSVLYVIPDAGKEEAVGAMVNSDNLAKWRQSLRPMSVNLEVPSAMLYTCSALTVEAITYEGFPFKTSKLQSRMSITYP
ncbi:hypothetical protein GDO81_018931, partial [Engystomops pustulosus]